MGKRIARKSAKILICILSVVIIGCSFGLFQRDKKYDDDISKVIYEAVDEKKIYYEGKEDAGLDVVAIMYNYVVYDYEDENLLMDMAEAVNAVIKEKKLSKKIHIVIWGKMPGGTEPVVSLRNYYKNEEGYEQYEFLQCLYIYGNDISYMGDDSIYNKASTYINLPDIKSLVIEKKIDQSAEDEGINWYEIWPELEHYKVLEK